MAKLSSYFQQALSRNHPFAQIESDLIKLGWDKTIIDSEWQEYLNQVQEQDTKDPLQPPTPAKANDIDLDLKKLSASQVLLYLGGLIVVIAGVIYIAINWSIWNSFLRVLAILVPLAILLGTGIYLWLKANSQKVGLVFLYTGSMLFPLFLVVFLNETKLFSPDSYEMFGLVVSGLSLTLYLIMHFSFKHPAWSFLYSITFLSCWLFLLRVLNMDQNWDYLMTTWSFLIPAGILIALGWWYEYQKQTDYSRFPYLLGNLTALAVLSILTVQNELFANLLNFIDDPNKKGAHSMILLGIIYLGLNYLAGSFKSSNFKEILSYQKLYQFVTVLAILSGVFRNSLGAHEPVWETFLLLGSLGFVFGSIPSQSRVYLYGGSLFLMVYIFDIGGEYFQDQVGWPITLFIAGLMCMGAGFGIERLRKKYF